MEKMEVFLMMKPLVIAQDTQTHVLLSNMANRHGLIAGATGTGKTVTLKVLSEAFSAIGVPVFLADVKGDLSGFCQAGIASEKLEERLTRLQMPMPEFDSFPVQFWDLEGQTGALVRATISDLGPLLLSRILDLNDNQSSLLDVVFRIADDQGLLLIDLKDLKQMLNYCGDNRKTLEADYGTYTKQSLGVILRKLIALEDKGANAFFGEPALDIHDFLRTDASGKGLIHILNAASVMATPALYATFLLWLLAELFETLPEVGDLDKPKLVFFFDEAHLLFSAATPPLLEKIHQVVRLIRSKGVGIYFVTQNPTDIPDNVLSQLGNRIQHALRAYTPKELKALKAAADTFRSDQTFDVEASLQELAVGEALVSLLDEKGTPTPVRRTWILPPRSAFGAASPERIHAVRSASLLDSKYQHAIDRESAYEILKSRLEAAQEANPSQAQPRPQPQPKPQSQPQPRPTKARTAKKSTAEDVLTSATKSFARSAMSAVGREMGGKLGKSLLRGLLGSLLK